MDMERKRGNPCGITLRGTSNEVTEAIRWGGGRGAVKRISKGIH